MKKITVFTPTYNRAFCLPQLYKSLKRQSLKDFCWLIIDDGSTDTTKELVETWIVENKIEINFVYQENQGMHGAHNTAYELIKTELNVCIDSDDYMPANAIELILNKWNTISDKPKFAGIVGLDIDKKGNIIGDKMPKNISNSSLRDLYNKHNVRGDKKLVYKTEIINKYPKYPLFEGERFVPLGTLYLRIDQDYELLCLNEPLCVVEYLSDGSSATIFKQYKMNPKGFRYARTVELNYSRNFKNSALKVLHFISSTLFIGDYEFFKNNPKKSLTFLCFPLGFLFHLFIIFKSKK